MVVVVVVVTAAVVAFLASACEVLGDDVETATTFEGTFLGAAAMGESLWVLVEIDDRASPSGHRIDLIEVALDDGAERSGRSVADVEAWRGVATFDGELLVRTKQDPLGLEPVRTWFGEAPNHLARINPTTARLAGRFEIPALAADEPLLVVDGRFYHVGARRSMDLVTGEDNFEPMADRPLTAAITSADVDDGEIQFTGPDAALRVDPVTDERFDNVSRLGAEFSWYDDQLWVTGAVVDDPDNGYRFDVASEQLGDAVPAADLPTRWFVSDGFRWELYSDRWTERPLSLPGPEDRWVQVDPASGERIAEYDLGSNRPFLAAGGYLWMVGLVDDGPSSITRVEIAG